jgi:hypothetical protein
MTRFERDGRPGRVFRGVLVAVVALALATTACARLASEEGSGARDGGAARPQSPDQGGGTAPGATGGGTGGDPGGAGSDDGGPPGEPGACDETPPADADPDTPVCHEVPPDEQPTDVPEPSPSPVEPRPGMAGVHPIGWDDADVAGDGRTVTLTFWSGVEPCYVLDHVDVRYGTETVTITLYEGSGPDAKDIACIEIAQYKSVTITLDEDLGDRKLVDGHEA